MSRFTKQLAIAGAAGGLFLAPPAEARLGSSLLDPFLVDSFLLSHSHGERSSPSGVNMFERSGSLVIEAPLPGVDENSVTLTLEKGTLAITGQREVSDREDTKYLYRSSNNYNYRIALPESIDQSDPKATFKNGMMTVEFELKQEEQSRQILFSSES
jgi:HSP20 family molecular chaperone IbpA